MRGAKKTMRRGKNSLSKMMRRMGSKASKMKIPKKGKKTSGKKTSGKKTSGKKTSGKKTSGKKTSGKKTSGKKPSGKKTSGKKRPPSAWNNHVMAVYKSMKADNPSMKGMGLAMQAAKKTYKKKPSLISVD
jgi:hypothetical protein